jgi:AcrR family transcriptional regulator
MPKLVDHASYRKQLLAQCLDLFAERGYSALTMRQISEALDVSTGTLYHYFPTKEALFQQLAEEITQQTVFEALAQAPSDSSFEDRLMSLLHFLEEHEEAFQKQFLITSDYFQHRDLYGENARAILRAGVERYDQCIQSYLRVRDAHLCTLLRYLINGLVMRRLLGDMGLSFVDEARPFVEIFVQAAGNTTGETEEYAGSPKEAEQLEER